MSKIYSIQKENYLSFTPSLACHIGVEAAIVVQKVAYLCNCPKSGEIIDGERWVWNTMTEWHRNFFPFWSFGTVRRIFEFLEAQGILLSVQRSGADRTKQYRISDAMFEKFTIEALDNFPSAQNERMDFQNAPLQRRKLRTCYKTESTSEQTTEQRVQKNLHHAVFSDRNPRPLPLNEEDMYASLEEAGIEIFPDHDGGFYDDMQKKDWSIRGKSIADWHAVYAARVQVTTSRDKS